MFLPGEIVLRLMKLFPTPELISQPPVQVGLEYDVVSPFSSEARQAFTA